MKRAKTCGRPADSLKCKQIRSFEKNKQKTANQQKRNQQSASEKQERVEKFEHFDATYV
jgi:hypothetical protein